MSSDPTQLRIHAASHAQTHSTIISIKFLSACFAGAVAGILGLENFVGFGLFVLSSMFTALCIYTINFQRRDLKKYVQGGVKELLSPGSDNIFTFLLVWTLFYGIVHVYD